MIPFFRHGGNIRTPAAAGGPVRIGIVSTTHDHKRNIEACVRPFNGCGVEPVIHAGEL
jgi:hypothetical protein